MYELEENYTAVYGELLEEDDIDAYELSKKKPVDELKADWILDALHRQGYISHVTSEGGELYSTEHFNIDTHQEIMEEFNL